jgi:two-component system, OmpR family, copper resistance phosphate regulon response regulator CusR
MNVMYQSGENSPKRILIIEDEYFISELYVRALTRSGYAVDLAVDGSDGAHKALSDKYDIILLDIMVPTLTGTEILKRLHDDLGNKVIKAKIIVTTNLEQSEETKESIEQQADGYIIKAEITPSQLVDFLSKLELE